ncbi:type III-A CRISPR-associated RAMP protein Csm4 [Parabacteroides sp. Marseille-P3160]|uniref:type III-A CRISPR-associated RAMP protein Csm4 n=1 Tax=Parabacteroides sp. Marseille-P3160 TaxID=1917887 RepID=UPI0009BAF38B|nr:type III-A CRISPR-associated RAMP protein Csm4 [Parabacteroides sp. Marseille-P3160]
MAAYTIIKLKNLTPLHIGTGKENYDFSASDLLSDTLSAALAALRVQTGKSNDVKEFLDSFRLSSAFPYYSNQYFLPKPQGKINVEVEKQKKHEYRKKLKKVKYIEVGLWQKLIEGERIVVTENQLRGDFLIIEPFSSNPISKSQVTQRVTVPRGDNQNADPFFFDWKYFDPNSGLFCLTDASGTILEEIINLFQLLGTFGLGTDKNVGGGRFEVETTSITINNPHDADHTILLSLYIPTEEELKILNLSDSRYYLLLRGGYMAGSQEESFRHLRKKSIYMFGVGSVFPTKEKLLGKIVDLKPDWNDSRMHAVYRSGKPFCLPIKIQSHE